MAGQLMDDLLSAQKAAKAAVANPTAKAYRSALVTKFKPDAGLATQAKKDRYAAVVLAFDLEFAKNNDPEKAKAAAEKVIQGTEGADASHSQASGTPSADLKALSTGTLSAQAYRQKHARSAAEAVAEAIRKGELTPAEAERALDALGL